MDNDIKDKEEVPPNLEIERKWLVTAPTQVPWNDAQGKVYKGLKQGYLAVKEDYEVRISTRNGCHITAKKGNGLVREETIEAISNEAFDLLWPLTEGRRISKTRYHIALGVTGANPKAYKAEVDVYDDENRGVITVEVEFDSEEDAHAFIPPYWFGTEVTGLHEYKNSTLAK